MGSLDAYVFNSLVSTSLIFATGASDPGGPASGAGDPDLSQRGLGALLAEIHEEWQGRRHLQMSYFQEWWDAQQPTDQEDRNVIGIEH